jgi:hypothetical protein
MRGKMRKLNQVPSDCVDALPLCTVLEIGGTIIFRVDLAPFSSAGRMLVAAPFQPVDPPPAKQLPDANCAAKPMQFYFRRLRQEERLLNSDWRGQRKAFLAAPTAWIIN